MVDIHEEPGTGNRGAESRRRRVGRRMRPVVLSVVGLAGGIVGLGLAVIPDILYAESDERRGVEVASEPTTGLTFHYRNVAVTLGAGKASPAPVQVARPKPARPFAVAGAVAGLLSLGWAAFAHVRERHKALTMCAVTCATAAIAWQYFAAGIAIGVAVVVVGVAAMILLRLFG